MKRALRNLICGLAALAMMAPLALAADDSGDDPDKVEEFNFEEDTVTTDFLKPNTMLVEGLRRGRASSLIAVRLDFVAEIVKSAEDI